jgi:hypothetical protein
MEEVDLTQNRAYESEQGVVVRSNRVYFPPVCPVCLSNSATSKLKVRCLDGDTKYRVVYTSRKVRYFKISYCFACASKLRISRFIRTLGFLVLFLLVYVVTLMILPEGPKIFFMILFLVIAAGPAFLGYYLAEKIGLRRDRGVSILSSADVDFNHFAFSHRQYLEMFLEANRKVTGR